MFFTAKKGKLKVKVAQSCLPLCDPMKYTVCAILQAWILELGSLSLLQWIFLTQGSNPGLPHCRWILYHLSHQGSPRILEWVACPFSSGYSQTRDWTQVSCIAGGLFTSWATKDNHQNRQFSDEGKNKMWSANYMSDKALISRICK